MKTKFTLTVLLLLLYIPVLFAQIPNFDFELWTDVGDWEDPDGWYTLNTLYDGNPETVRTTGDAFSGLTAARMENKEDDNGNVVRSMMVSGTHSLSDNPGFAYSKRPYSLEGYWQYNPQDNDDSCYVLVYLTHYNAITQSRDIIGSGLVGSGDDMDDYTLFSAPINYVSSQFPDSAYIVIYAGKFNGALDGSRLLIDALSFNETTTAGSEPPGAGIAITLFPNPASGSFTIQHLTTTAPAMISLFDYTGMLKKSVAIDNNHATVNVNDLNEGIYFYEIRNENRELVKTGKVMVQ